MIRAFDTLESDIDFALKSSLTECLKTRLRAALVKGLDEIADIAARNNAAVHAPPPSPVLFSRSSNDTSSNIPSQTRSYEAQLDCVQGQLEALNAKQDVQFRLLTASLDRMTDKLSRVVMTLEHPRHTDDMKAEVPQSILPMVVTAETVIPSLQPTASASFTGCAASEEEAEEEVVEEEVVEEEAEEAPAPAAGAPIQETEEVEEEAEEEAVEEEVVEEEVVEEEGIVEEEEEGVEVEEWTFKGRKYFKDTENKVYANVNDDVGDYLGTYDPVKNIVKK